MVCAVYGLDISQAYINLPFFSFELDKFRRINVL